MDMTQLKSWVDKNTNTIGVQAESKNTNWQVGVNPSVLTKILNNKTLDASMPYTVKATSPYVQGSFSNNVDGAGTSVRNVSAQLPLGPVEIRGSVDKVNNSTFGYGNTDKTLGLAAKIASGNLEAQRTKNSQGNVRDNISYSTPFMGGNLQGNYYSNPYNKGLAFNYSRSF